MIRSNISLNNLITNNSDEETNGENLIIKNIIKDNSIIFDVGARDTTIPFLNQNSEYHLFEPISYNFDKLNETFKNFKNVKINNYCLSDINEKVEIYKESESINRRIGFNYVWERQNDSRVKNGSKEKINCITLSDYIEKNNIKKIDLIKIDVEGYEYKVLKGLGNKIDIVENIMFEYGVGTYMCCNVELIDVINLLSNKYSFYIIQNDGLIPINLLDQTIYEKIKPIGYCNLFAKKNG
jgi:FkbM family methyltransferase